MKSMKKAVLLVICAFALVTAAVFGTLAYLTDQTEVVNTFTVGNVSIELDEAVVDPDGNPVDEDEDGKPDRTNEGNEYHLIPGQTYTKDPTMTVLAGSDAAYIRMRVTVTDFDDVKELIKKYVGSDVSGAVAELSKWLALDADGCWELNGITQGNDTVTLEFRYKEIVNASDATEDIKLDPLFTAFTVPAYVTADDLATLDNFTISVIGEAMQATGFDSSNDAWAEFNAQGAKVTEATPVPVSATVAPTSTDTPEVTE